MKPHPALSPVRKAFHTITERDGKLYTAAFQAVCQDQANAIAEDYWTEELCEAHDSSGYHQWLSTEIMPQTHKPGKTSTTRETHHVILMRMKKLLGDK